MPPFSVFISAGLRFGIAALALAGWAFATGRSLEFKKDQARHIFLLFL